MRALVLLIPLLYAVVTHVDAADKKKTNAKPAAKKPTTRPPQTSFDPCELTRDCDKGQNCRYINNNINDGWCIRIGDPIPDHFYSKKPWDPPRRRRAVADNYSPEEGPHDEVVNDFLNEQGEEDAREERQADVDSLDDQYQFLRARRSSDPESPMDIEETDAAYRDTESNSRIEESDVEEPLLKEIQHRFRRGNGGQQEHESNVEEDDSNDDKPRSRRDYGEYKQRIRDFGLKKKNADGKHWTDILLEESSGPAVFTLPPNLRPDGSTMSPAELEQYRKEAERCKKLEQELRKKWPIILGFDFHAADVLRELNKARCEKGGLPWPPNSRGRDRPLYGLHSASGLVANQFLRTEIEKKKEELAQKFRKYWETIRKEWENSVSKQMLDEWLETLLKAIKTLGLPSKDEVRNYAKFLRKNIPTKYVRRPHFPKFGKKPRN